MRSNENTAGQAVAVSVVCGIIWLGLSIYGISVYVRYAIQSTYFGEAAGDGWRLLGLVASILYFLIATIRGQFFWFVAKKDPPADNT